MDEVGFYVKDITNEGFLRIDQAGGWIDQTILSQRWIIMTSKGPVIGYSGIESGHAITSFPTSNCHILILSPAKSAKYFKVLICRYFSSIAISKKYF